MSASASRILFITSKTMQIRGIRAKLWAGLVIMMKSINLCSQETTAGIVRVKDSIIPIDRTVKQLQKLS